MSTRQKTRQPVLWVVILGLFLLIGLIAGGTYTLNEAGLLGSAAMPDGAAPPDFTADGTAGSETFTPPEGMLEGRHDEDGSGTLVGFVITIVQLALVIMPVYYGQKLFGWLEKRLRKPKLTGQAT